MVPFNRPGSASLLSLDDQVPTAFVAPPATGRTTQPLLVPATPAAFGACTGDAWRAAATYVDVNAGVSACFSGLDTAEWHQVGSWAGAFLRMGRAVSAALLDPASSASPTCG